MTSVGPKYHKTWSSRSCCSLNGPGFSKLLIGCSTEGFFFLGLVCCENSSCFRNCLPWWPGQERNHNHILDERVYSYMGWGHNALLWAVWSLIKNSWSAHLKRWGRNPIPGLGFSYPDGFSVFKFQARTGMQIEASCLLIEDLKSKVGSYPISELFPLLCFVASALFTSSIRSNETQRPSC